MSTETKEGFNEVLIEPLRQFAKDSMHLVKKCTKPDRKEFLSIARAVGVGFLMMGFIGFFVKLIHIPINNILVGAQKMFYYGKSTASKTKQANMYDEGPENSRNSPNIFSWGAN